ncbi:hypothetical protein MRX96_027174 [Rhipicephalus microplus]
MLLENGAREPALVAKTGSRGCSRGGVTYCAERALLSQPRRQLAGGESVHLTAPPLRIDAPGKLSRGWLRCQNTCAPRLRTPNTLKRRCPPGIRSSVHRIAHEVRK